MSGEGLLSVMVTDCFVKNTVNYFNLFVRPFKQRDMSVMIRVSNSVL